LLRGRFQELSGIAELAVIIEYFGEPGYYEIFSLWEKNINCSFDGGLSKTCDNPNSIEDG
jgi:hypothetical protein